MGQSFANVQVIVKTAPIVSGYLGSICDPLPAKSHDLSSGRGPRHATRSPLLQAPRVSSTSEVGTLTAGQGWGGDRRLAHVGRPRASVPHGPQSQEDATARCHEGNSAPGRYTELPFLGVVLTESQHRETPQFRP